MVKHSKAAQIRASYLSERLYHFFARTAVGDEAQGIDVFKSIVENGLLLTIANQAGEADAFTFSGNAGQVIVHIEQLARVCFTDIPEDKLDVHSEDAKYGRFGIGFSRATIVSWAGAPVWYLANPGAGGLTDAAGVMLQYLRFGRNALQVLKVLYQHPNCRPALNFADGAVLTPDDVINRSDLADGSIARALSFVKEMSPQNAPEQEFQYLYEREWRIVDGLKMNGISICKPLPNYLRETLIKAHPAWGEPIKSTIDGFKNQYFTQPMIDHFRLFNGVDTTSDTVAKRIENVFVPTVRARRQIEEYIATNSEKFSVPPPTVKIFGRRRSRILSFIRTALRRLTGRNW